jgi:hypothetical protein
VCAGAVATAPADAASAQEAELGGGAEVVAVGQCSTIRPSTTWNQWDWVVANARPLAGRSTTRVPSGAYFV